MSFLNVTKHHPNEAAVIGRLLAGYTEKEVDLQICVDAVFNDMDAVFKAMFRTRGETQRIEIADGLARNKFHAIGLGSQFEMAIGAIHLCRRIRNQYSHCHWHATPSNLGFVDL